MSTNDDAYRTFIFTMVAAAIMTPLFAIVFGKYLSLTWDWFLRPEYGDGPSIKAWFGIVTIGQLIRMRTIATETPEFDKRLKERPIATLIQHSVTHIVGGACALGIVYFTGRLMGWC